MLPREKNFFFNDTERKVGVAQSLRVRVKTIRMVTIVIIVGVNVEGIVKSGCVVE